MVPFSDFEYFGLLLYVLLPFGLLGILGRLNRASSLVALGILLVLQTSVPVHLRPDFAVTEFYIIAAYTVYQGLLALWLFRCRSRSVFYSSLALSILPLAAAKVLPTLVPQTSFGFLGISYVTFRALDVLFSVQDGLLKELSLSRYAAYLLFVPALSSGPVDRYRRFVKDWDSTRTSAEFVNDLDVVAKRLAQGFLYKFVIAALINTHWIDALGKGRSLSTLWLYMYAYTLYLFFDFAGYSAFAIAVARFFGVHLPENFDRPFLSRNIRDFWNRWHISLSFWFRDHVYMRFLLAASKGKWFQGKHTASYCGLFVTFGIMGVWHGLSLHYVLYGLYHAALLCGYDWFARWNKQRKLLGESALQIFCNRLLTFHAIAFGLLLFSGRLTPPPPPPLERLLEKADTREVTGILWDKAAQNETIQVDLYVDEQWIQRLPANIQRDDLKERGFGSGKHGFRFELPWWVRDGRPHLIEVKDARNSEPLDGSAQTVECERNDEEIRREEEKLQKAREAALEAQPSQTPPPVPK